MPNENNIESPELDIAPDQIQPGEIINPIDKTEFGNKAFSRNWSITEDGNAIFKDFALTGPSRTRMFLSADNTIAVAGTYQIVPYDSETYDELNEGDTTNNKWVAKTDGYYLIISQTMAGTITNAAQVAVQVRLNGTAINYSQIYTGANGFETILTSDIRKLAGGDKIEVFMKTSSLTYTPSITGGTTATYLTIHKIS